MNPFLIKSISLRKGTVNQQEMKNPKPCTARLWEEGIQNQGKQPGS